MSSIVRQLRAAVELVSEGIVFQNADGQIVDCNPAAERILGLSADQMKGKTSLDPDWCSIKEDGSVLPGDEHPAMITLRSGLSLRNFVFGVGSRNRVRRWISVNTDPIYGESGKIEFVVACFTDVTDEREKSRSLEVIVNASKIGTWDWDIPSGHVTFNSQWAQMLGYDLSEIEPTIETWEQLVAPEAREQSWKIVREHLEGKMDEYRNELQMLQRDGTYRWILGIGRVISRDIDSNPLRMVGIHIDISESKKREADLRILTGRYEAAILGTSDGLWDCACDSDHVWYSDRFWTLLGYPDGGPYPPNKHQSFVEHLHPEDIDSTRNAIQRSQRDGRQYEHQYRLRLQDGTFHWFLGRGNVQLNSQGKVVRLSGTIRDINDVKLAEMALCAAKEAATNANAVKSAFLANMSHEIRTPLTAILGFADLLAIEVNEPSNSGEKLEFIGAIQRNGEHLLQLINDILDISKIEAEKVTLERLVLPLPELIGDIATTLKVKAEVKGVDLIVKIEPDVPNYIHSDPVRLRQVLLNLVGNAIKFTNQGSVTIRAHLDKNLGHLVFTIVDTGIGLTSEQIPKLFGSFEQADVTTSRKYGGTGLGLRISKGLAALLGGDISVQSEFGHGSTFSFYLNRSSYEVSALGPDIAKHYERKKPPTQNSIPSAANLLSGLRILLVEDSQDNQRLIGHILRKARAIVQIAENGRDAICMLTDDGTVAGNLAIPLPFHLILSDIQMPEIDGYEMARLLAAKGSRLPLIALTAHAMSDEQQRCLNAGFLDYASKPIEKDALIAMCHIWGSVVRT